jgi:hypothetical protein
VKKRLGNNCLAILTRLAVPVVCVNVIVPALLAKLAGLLP